MTAPAPAATASPSENLALAFQEILTAVVRIRANRHSVSDVRAFRANMREALKAAVRDARRFGYSDDEIQFATLAAVGFLDESILNSQDPVFADWARETLSHELFGHHLAGEIFFSNLERLLGMQDSAGLAGVLDVYRLCLLLGFTGKFGAGKKGEIRILADLAARKIGRIRGSRENLFPPQTTRANGTFTPGADPYNRRLLYLALACFCLALVLFTGFYFALSSGVSQLETISRVQPG
jgi:type VI secretion system protein ImpK